MTWLLIDADMLLYQAVTSCETEIEWEPDVITTHLPLKEVKYVLHSLIESKQKQVDAKRTTLCWTASDNFRKTIDPTYKGNRRETKHRIKPVGFKRARTIAEVEYESECWYKLEADDVLGILATKHTDKDVVIWSGDKDLNQIPGAHLSNDGDIYEISKEEADLYFYRQVLIGDAVDNYSGCPGVGPKTAEKLIPVKNFKPHDAWQTILNTYKKKGLSKELALQQARLARILRDTEYVYDLITLWMPPTQPITDMIVT